jgi:hypothetical protein
MARAPGASDADELKAEALRLVEAEGAAAAARRLDAHPDPALAAKAYAQLVRELYRARKDVDGMIAVAQAGVARSLAAAEAAADAKAALNLRSAAKTLAFNAAANCWPGWDDPGVTLTSEHLAAGLALARTCLGLVDELGLGAMQEANAHWLVAALRLAAGEAQAAQAEFEAAEAAFGSAGDGPATLMARGYRALAGAGGDEALAAALGRLTLDGSKDALFYRDQLLTAQRALATWRG